MISTLIDICIGLALVTIGAVVWHIVHTWYKEREWKKNNPDEYRMIYDYDLDSSKKTSKRNIME